MLWETMEMQAWVLSLTYVAGLTGEGSMLSQYPEDAWRAWRGNGQVREKVSQTDDEAVVGRTSF